MAETKVRNVLDDLEISEDEADALIGLYVRLDPAHHGRDRARTGPEGWTIPVWQIIAYLREADAPTVASAYELPEEAVIAAVAYYRRHQDLIDARILLQNEQFINV